MGEISATQAALIALWVTVVQARALGYSTLMLRFSPMMTGLVVGLVLGNVPLAMTITAAIQLIYMGMIAPGGAMPSEPAVATAVAVPVAMLAGLAPTEAIAVAVPVGLLGSYIYSFRFFINSFIVRLMDKYAAEANDKGLTFAIIILPILVSMVLFFPLLFIGLYAGAPVIASFLAQLSGGIVFHVLGAVGGGLAALGIALIMKVIGKTQFIVFFLLAYFMAVSLKSLGINTVTYAIIGGIIAYLYTICANENVER
ncbi:PTS mannose/fructose/sorbose/N-acetylgalactosamine transporter subunit IIC [Propionispora vibrioides]|jgi:D-glucosaminate-specific PTS system IIC component|uniref:PTS system, mannose-specific IIC component n=1 Tax=Propionispora vibrioides TaxID=112903 RepID=A0A1H8U980_9FIRM|nr:PTS sugar transporter subunit IIC [Propionispora vibrioides]SEO99607.1 PTS system, mannose-specific IIC component [Propionispora vibrioides]